MRSSAQDQNQHNYALDKPMLGLRHLYDLDLDLRLFMRVGNSYQSSIQRINDFNLRKNRNLSKVSDHYTGPQDKGHL